MTPEVKQRIEQIRRGEVPEGYKKTALGIVPANWIETTLGEIYTERNEPGNDSLPLLMVSIHSGVSDGEVAEEDLPRKAKRIEDKSQYKHAMPGDLVFNMMRAWQGAIGSVRTEGMVSPAYIVAKPNDMVDPIFMDYYMKMPRMISMIHRQSYGVTDFRLRLYWDSFSPIPCVLPPIEEQKRIAEILSVQDTLISLQRKEVAAYQQLEKSFLAILLPKGGSNEPELRFKGFTDAWEQRKLGDITGKTYGGGTPKTSVHEYWGGSIPWIQSSNLTEHQLFDAGVQKYITDAGLQQSATQLVPKNSIAIVSHVGVGKLVFMPFEYTTSQDFISLSDLTVDPVFACYVIYKKLQEDVHIVQGSAIKGITKAVLLNKEISVPGKEEQKAIGTLLQSIDNLITLHQRKADHTLTKKDVLMQLLMTGQLQVSV